MRFVSPNFLARTKRCRSGFTLIEAAMVTVIIGTGVIALMQLLAAGTMANKESTELTTALNLASNIREISLAVPYADVMTTLNNRSYTPPIDAKSVAITSLPNWKQVVMVNYVDANKVTRVVPNTQLEPTARITVTISHNNQVVYSTEWLTAASSWPLP